MNCPNLPPLYVSFTQIDFISTVPETTKKKYIFAAKQLQDLCVQDGQHRMNMIVKSSGHSGRQCYWAK